MISCSLVPSHIWEDVSHRRHSQWIIILFPFDCMINTMTSMASSRRCLWLDGKQLVNHPFSLYRYGPTSRCGQVFSALTAVVAPPQTRLTLCMFHGTRPCGVCFLWGFGEAVSVLDGGCWRHAGVECGSRGADPSRWILVFQSYEVCVRAVIQLKPVSNHSSQWDSGSDGNENQMLISGKGEKKKKMESQRRGSYYESMWKGWSDGKGNGGYKEELICFPWGMQCNNPFSCGVVAIYIIKMNLFWSLLTECPALHMPNEMLTESCQKSLINKSGVVPKRRITCSVPARHTPLLHLLYVATLIGCSSSRCHHHIVFFLLHLSACVASSNPTIPACTRCSDRCNDSEGV